MQIESQEVSYVLRRAKRAITTSRAVQAPLVFDVILSFFSISEQIQFLY